MAFHFQPQADSSDDEQVDLTAWQSDARPKSRRAPIGGMDGAGDNEVEDAINISVFSQIRGTYDDDEIAAEDGEEDEDEVIEIPDVPDLVVEEEDGGEEKGVAVQEIESDTPCLDTSREQSESRKRKRGRPANTFKSPSFTSINKRPSPPSTDEESTKATQQTTRRSGRSAGKPDITGGYIPLLPRVDLDELEDDIQDFTAGRHVVRMVKKEMAGRDGDIAYKVEFVDRHVEEVCSKSLARFLRCACLALWRPLLLNLGTRDIHMWISLAETSIMCHVAFVRNISTA